MELALEARGDPADAWEKYRQVVTLTLRYRKAVEKVAPFSPNKSREAGKKFAARFSPRGPDTLGALEGSEAGPLVHFGGTSDGHHSGEDEDRGSGSRRPPPSISPAADILDAFGAEAEGGDGVEVSKGSRVSNLRRPTLPPAPPPPMKPTTEGDEEEAEA